MNLTYEIIIIDELDKSEITTSKSLSKALAYSEKTWENPVIKETSKDVWIEDKTLGISLKPSKMGSSGDVFLISVEGQNFNKLENFRHKLLTHIIKLGFSKIVVVTDSISETISSGIYPKIKEVENFVRKSLVKSSLKNDKISINYSKTAADKIKSRKSVANTFSKVLDMDSSLTDFEDLTELVGKSSTYNDAFRTKWKQLAVVRDKVLAYTPLTSEDLNNVTKLCKELTSSDLAKATNGQAVPSKVEKAPTTTAKVAPKETKPVAKQPIAKPAEKKPVAKPVAAKPAENKTVNVKPVVAKPVEKKTVPAKPNPAPTSKAKVEAKPVAAPIIVKSVTETKKAVAPEVKVAPKPVINKGYEIISENTFLAELKKFESTKNGQPVNLKDFVNETLANMGYAAGACYSASRNLSDSGKVTIFETKDEIGLIVKAIHSV